MSKYQQLVEADRELAALIIRAANLASAQNDRYFETDAGTWATINSLGPDSFQGNNGDILPTPLNIVLNDPAPTDVEVAQARHARFTTFHSTLEAFLDFYDIHKATIHAMAKT